MGAVEFGAAVEEGSAIVDAHAAGGGGDRAFALADVGDENAVVEALRGRGSGDVGGDAGRSDAGEHREDEEFVEHGVSVFWVAKAGMLVRKREEVKLMAGEGSGRMERKGKGRG